MEQTDKSVAFGDLTEYFHDQHIVIHRQILFFVHGRQLKLRRSHLIVAGAGGNAQFPELLLHFAHEIEDPGADGAEIVIFKLLVFRRGGAEKGAPCLEQIRTLEIKVPVDEEILLLCPE